MRSITDPAAVTRSSAAQRRGSRGRVLAALRRQGAMPRVSLVRATGLSFAAVSAITAALIAEGVVVEGESEGAPQGRGRPAVELDLSPGFGRVAAVSLRMNLIEVLLADFRGRPLAQRRLAVATRELDGDELERLLVEQVRILVEAAPGAPLLGIGLACQGMVDAARGRQLWSPALAVTDVPIAEPLRRAFGVPVAMANDAVALALAVAAGEPALASGLSATVMVGHGIGMGVLVDGVPALGDGGVGSEIGHVKHAPDGPQCRCGQRGCIEAYLADYALYRDARTFLELPPSDSQQPSEAQMALLYRRAREGDPRLRRLFHQAGRALADAVAATVSVLGPRHVILAGTGLQAFELMRPAYEERLAEAALPWLLARTEVLLRPGGPGMIVEGMAARTLALADQAIGETATAERPLATAG